MKRIGVLLAGSGVFDGSEIHESVLTLLSIEKNGAGYSCFAPAVPQKEVVDHVSGTAVPNETRSVLVESGRIARGQVADIATFNPRDFDALIVPGGFGVPKNLLLPPKEIGPAMKVHPHVAKCLRQMHECKVRPSKYIAGLSVRGLIGMKIMCRNQLD